MGIAVDPIVASFRMYRKWLQERAPSLEALLNGPASSAAIEVLEKQIGKALPESLRALWLECNGQRTVDNAQGVAAGFWFLSVEESARQWSDWDEIRNDPWVKPSIGGASSTPDNAIDIAYTNAGWVPVFQETMEGNYVGVDLAPDIAGVVGQVINFGRDEDEKYVLARDLADVVAWLVREAEQGALRVRTHREVGKYLEHEAAERLPHALELAALARD